MSRVSLSRRRLLAGAAGAVGIAVLQRVALTQIEVPPDATKVPGRPLSALGQRSPFERPRRLVSGVNQGSSLTPLQDLCGIVTPSDLHYERHHAGVPAIDPHRYKLLIHGMVERPTVFDLAALRRFPAVSRLYVPGWEGSANVKWIRRIELADRPFMTREETAKYTDPLPNGTARMFSFVMDAKSIITSPAYPATLPERGWWEISGLAWSGRGRVTRVDVSTDAGKTWAAAELQEPVLPKCHTRFCLPWNWDGREAMLMSRAVDETGYLQPTLAELRKVRGSGAPYHFNNIRAWRVRGDGAVHWGLEV